MKKQLKQAFKSGWLARNGEPSQPKEYIDKIADNAFKQWYYNPERRDYIGLLPNLHILKTVNPHFQNVWDDLKPFEIRENDRDFKKGDLLLLREYRPPSQITQSEKKPFMINEKYTGRQILAIVILVTDFPQGMKDNYVALSMNILNKKDYPK